MKTWFRYGNMVVGTTKLINKDQTVTKLPHQITNAKFNVHDEDVFRVMTLTRIKYYIL